MKDPTKLRAKHLAISKKFARANATYYLLRDSRQSLLKCDVIHWLYTRYLGWRLDRLEKILFAKK